jgi:CRP/FNR family transcriptional regulator, polysaccharide utilization system transcription regulator
MKKMQIPLMDCIVFKNISSITLSQLNEIREIKKYKKDSAVFYEGKNPTSIYCIHEGHIKIFKNGRDGDNKIIHISNPGDLIGWEQLTEGSFNKNAVALEDITLSSFPIDGFLNLLKADSLFSLEFAKYLCKGKLLLEYKVLHLLKDSLRQRLALNLLLLAEKFGINYQDNILLRIPLSRMDMASLIGTNPETVFKLLSQFKKEGLIDFVDKRMLILNPPLLRNISDS